MKTKTILNSLIIAIIMLAGSLQADAQENQKKSIFGIANRVGLGVGAGTEGIGIDVATPLSRYVHASFGVNIMPDIKINTTHCHRNYRRVGPGRGNRHHRRHRPHSVQP